MENYINNITYKKNYNLLLQFTLLNFYITTILLQFLHYSNKITNKMTIKLQIKEIILLAYCKFTNAWKFISIIVGLQNYPL